MARRGKTVIKGGPNQQNMMRALEQGESAVHRASESLRDQQNIDYQDRNQLAETVGQGVGDAQRFKMAQDEKGEAKKAAAEKQTYERGITEKEMQLDRDKATSQAAQKERDAQFKAAEAGREAPPSNDPLLARKQQVGSEMQQGTGAGQPDPGGGTMAPGMPQSEVGGPPPEDPAERGRQHDQMSKPLGDHPYALNEEGQQARGHEQSMDTRKADMDRAREISNRMRAHADWEKALILKDDKGRAEARERLQKDVKNLSGALDNVMNDEPLTKSQLAKVIADSEGHPIQELLRRHNSMIQNKGYTEADQAQVTAFMKNNRDRAGVDFVEKTGELPDSGYIDLSSFAWQAFTRGVQYVNETVKAVGAGNYLGIRTGEEKSRLLNKLGAAYAKRGLAPPQASPEAQQQQPQAQQQQPQGGATAGGNPQMFPMDPPPSDVTAPRSGMQP